MYDSRDKVVLVTGAAAGIGAVLVKSFLDEGVSVSIIVYKWCMFNMKQNL